MTSFVATLKVRADRVEDFERLAKELIEFTREHEPDTYAYELVRSRDNALSYIWYARFKDQAAFDAHMDAEAHHRLVPPLLETLSEDMGLAFYDHI